MLCFLAKKCLAKFSAKNHFSRFFSFEMLLLLNKFRAGKHMGEEMRKKDGSKNTRKIRRGALSHTFILLGESKTTSSSSNSSNNNTFEGGRFGRVTRHIWDEEAVETIYNLFAVQYVLQKKSCAAQVFNVFQKGIDEQQHKLFTPCTVGTDAFLLSGEETLRPFSNARRKCWEY